MTARAGLSRLWAALSKPREPLLQLLRRRRAIKQALASAGPTLEIGVTVLGQAAPDEELDRLADLLCAAGLPRDEGRRCAVLLPLAFGRALLSEMGVRSFSDDAYVHVENGDPVLIRLSDQPIYRAGLPLGVCALRHGAIAHDTFGAIAALSPEVQAALHAIETGSQAAGFSVEPFHFLGHDPALFVRRRPK